MTLSLPDLQATAAARFEDLRRQGTPGCVVGIAIDGERSVRPLGTADLRIGSVSKLVVAGVIDALAGQGALQWPDRLSAHLPEVPDSAAFSLDALGKHRTGYRDALENPAFRRRYNQNPAAAFPIEDVLAASLSQPRLKLRPGTSRYANVNAILLALTAERATGEPYPALAERLVLRPARADLRADPTSAGRSARGYRHGRISGVVEHGAAFFEATKFNPSWAGPAGDLSGNMQALLRLGASLKPLFAAAPKAPAPLQAPAYWRLISLWRNGAGHAGDVPGYSAFLGCSRDGRLLVGVLSNLSNLANGRAPATEIAATLFERWRSGGRP
ncbi:MAG: serine hydrolase domain-containing protein [Pseudomonadota bacterium]